jgi:hypothetical protein
VVGCGHGPLDFHAPIKALFNLQVLVTKGFEGGWSRTPSLVTWRRLVGGLEFEKMRVAIQNRPKIMWVEISMGHTSFLVNVESPWVQDPGSCPKSS